MKVLVAYVTNMQQYSLHSVWEGEIIMKKHSFKYKALGLAYEKFDV